MSDSEEEIKIMDSNDQPEKSILTDSNQSGASSVDDLSVDALLQILQNNFNAANEALKKTINDLNITKETYENAKDNNLKAHQTLLRAQNELFTNQLSLLQNTNIALNNRLKLLMTSASATS